MSEDISVFERLKSFIREFHNGKSASGGREITKKCHLCGDSRNEKSRHMYIGMQKDTGLIVYNCFKCNSSGIVSSRFLREMDQFHDTMELGRDIDRWNRERMNDPRNVVIKNIENSRIYSPRWFVRDDQDTAYKVAMFNKRLGTNLSAQDLCNYKIVINLKDFLYANYIKNYTRHPDVVEILDRYFMGFLSIDNSYINLRRLAPEGKLPEFIDKRYVNYNVLGKIDNTFRHYVVPASINTLSLEPIKIYIAEGGYDALSLRLNVIDNPNQCIFSSIGGKSYFMMVKFFLEKYGFINAEFHLCPDGDVPNDDMYYIAEIIRPFNIPVYIHRNTSPGEKDFGVSKNRIIDSCIRIL